MNIFNLDRIAFEELHPYKITDDPHAMRNAALSLAHHLRAHGLSATVGYGLEGDKHTQKITDVFIEALHKACTIAGPDNKARAHSLKTETTATYLLHSRLALPLADGFALAAKALWPTDDSTPDGAQEQTAQETSHV